MAERQGIGEGWEGMMIEIGNKTNAKTLLIHHGERRGEASTWKASTNK